MTKTAHWLLHEGALAFADAEQRGMRIDVPYCEKMYEVLNRRIQRQEKKLRQSDLGKKWGKRFRQRMNTKSADQLRWLIYDYYKTEPFKWTKNDQPSIDNEVLQVLNIDGLEHLIQIRKWTKARDTYILGMLREQTNGVLHPFFNLHTARTFRSSSDRINFHNFPKRDKELLHVVRRAVLPPKGFAIVDGDYGGIEVHAASWYNQDPVLLEYNRNPNSDMHYDMALQIFELDTLDKSHHGEYLLRYAAKNGFVFPQFYGDYYVGCAKSLLKWAEGLTLSSGKPVKQHLQEQGKGTYKKFEKHIEKIEEDFWERRFRVYTGWKEKWKEQYRKRGYFDLFTGFRCSGVMRDNQIVNYPMQGTGFHCLLRSFIRLNQEMKRLRFKSGLFGQIHDDAVSYVHPKEAREYKELLWDISVNELRKQWPWVITPVEVDLEACEVDHSWAESHNFDEIFN